MQIQFVDADGRPISGAPVAVARSPGEVRDLGLVTDALGRVGFDVDIAGDYAFAVFVGGQARTVAAHLGPGTQVRLVVPS
jgi:hypothetical protein